MALPLTQTDKDLLLSAFGTPETRDRVIALLNLAGTGDMTGPGLSVDNALVRWSGTAGTTTKNSSATLDNSGNLVLTGTITATNFSANSITALTGDVSASGPGSATATISAATVTGKVLTGFVSGSGVVSATDTVLQGFNKLDGNVALKSPLASPTFTGTVTLPSGSVTATLWATGASNMTVGGAGNAAIGLNVLNTNLTGTTQYGVYSNITATSAANVGVYGFAGDANTAASTPTFAQFFARNTAATGSISNRFAFLGVYPTGGTTSNTFLSDTIAPGGDFGIYLATSNPSQFTGQIKTTGGGGSTSTTTGQLIVTGGAGISQNLYVGAFVNSPLYISATANPASAGTFRLATSDSLTMRNPGNTADITTISVSGLVPGTVTTADANLGTISSVTLDKYYVGTASVTFQGAFTAGQAKTINYIKIGRVITLHIPSTTAAVSNATTINNTGTELPSGLRPNLSTKYAVNGVFDNNGADTNSALQIDTAGLITIYATAAGGSFTASGTAGWDRAISITYYSAN